MQTDEENAEKKIIFKGTNNRYQMKKAMKTQEKDKKRKVTEKWNLEEEDYTFEKQMAYLWKLLGNTDNFSTGTGSVPIEKFNDITLLYIQQIERKIAGYKQQDIEKKCYDPSKIVQYIDVLSLLIKAECKCFYCKEELFVLYEKVREGKQWTLDRINNDIGHYCDNVVVACLDCNLKRKRRSKDSFLFTKQLIILQKEKENDNEKEGNGEEEIDK